MESNLISFSAVTCLPARAVLVLAPHPDDEVFGCGGAIAAHVQSDAVVQVVILTDGAIFGDAVVRANESVTAAQVLGYGTPDFWLLPDRGVFFSEVLVRRISERIVAAGIDLVYAPSPWEVHSDHRQTCMLAMEAVKRAGYPVRLAFYEVGAPLRPNVLVDITRQVKLKQLAMNCFASQLAQQDYARHISALNIYRTYTLLATVKAAEAFLLLSAAELARGDMAQLLMTVSPGLSDGVRDGVKVLPLVSVLVRSMDRAFLAQALDSVALQTYPNIEILVVAAKPGHSPLPERCGPFPLTLHQPDVPMLRSRAANEAMSRACGDLFLFLDDDDWLMPGHIARLAEVLARLPDSLAAYTGIALVDAQNHPNGQMFDLPFDAVRLLAGNLTPIHAVLFRRKVMRLGCHFDEALDRYEDWDFWHQLSKLAPMVHLPGVSAAYRVHDSSGVHEDSGPLSEANLTLYKKYEATWSSEQLGAMMMRVWGFADLENSSLEITEQLSDTKAELLRLEQKLAENEQKLAEAEFSGELIRKSISWRLTEPLRSHSGRFGLPRVRRIYRVFLTEGWRGVAYRLRQRFMLLPANTISYRDWTRQFDTPSPLALKKLIDKMALWPTMPLISVVMPVYNPPLDLLQQAISSIQAQIYPNWELCIADDASPDLRVWQLLAAVAVKDKRIKIVQRNENGHISKASNSALALAQGEFVALMDNDDLLPPDALFWVAEAVNRIPTVQVIYSDEDKLDSQGLRFGPYFKPDWNYALFLGHNLISHLGVYRTSLMREVGGFRPGLEGSQDYDLALRCIERVAHSDIVHIPRVLYHWRAIEGSTALANDAKPYAAIAAQQALQEHCNRIGCGGLVEILPTSNYRCRRPKLHRDVRLSLVLVCPTGSPAESSAAAWSRDAAFNVSEVLWCADEAQAINTALARVQGHLVALVRVDLMPSGPESLMELTRLALESDTGMAGGTVRDAGGSLVAGGLVLNATHIASVMLKNLPNGHPGYMGRGLLTQELSALSMDCVVFRTQVVAECGGVDPVLGISRSGCVEFCLRLHDKGKKTVWCPDASWITVTDRPPLDEKDLVAERKSFMERFGAQYAHTLRADPAYHPLLDATAADFSLRKPVE